MAEDAISQIMNSQIPEGEPMEGPVEHLKTLQKFMQTDHLGMLQPEQVELFQQYLSVVQQKVQEFQRQQQLLQAAQTQFGGQGQAGRPPEGGPPSMDNPQVSGNELLDESLPSPGGGG